MESRPWNRASAPPPSRAHLVPSRAHARSPDSDASSAHEHARKRAKTAAPPGMVVTHNIARDVPGSTAGRSAHTFRTPFNLNKNGGTEKAASGSRETTREASIPRAALTRPVTPAMHHEMSDMRFSGTHARDETGTTRISDATYQSSSPALAPPANIPRAGDARAMVGQKAITHELTMMKDSIQCLQDNLNAADIDLGDALQSIQHLKEAVAKAEDNNEQMGEWAEKQFEALFARLEIIEKKQDDFILQFEDPTSHAADLAEQQKNARNNALASTVQAIMHKAMRTKKSDPPPEPLPGGAFWQDSPEEEDERTLRPDWKQSYQDNAVGWEADLIDQVIDQGAMWGARMSKEELAETPRPVIARAIRQYFTTLAKKHNDREARTTQEIDISAAVRRRKGRREGKATARSQVRHKVPGANDPSMDFLFKWQYQSGDESEEIDDPRVDPNSPSRRGRGRGSSRASASGAKQRGRDRNTQGKPVKITVFRDRRPEYRTDELEDWFRSLDKEVRLMRNDLPAKVRRNIVERREGEPEDVPLPLIKNTKKSNGAPARIPRHMVNQKWLEEHPEFDKPQYFAPSDREEDGSAVKSSTTSRPSRSHRRRGGKAKEKNSSPALEFPQSSDDDQGAAGGDDEPGGSGDED